MVGLFGLYLALAAGRPAGIFWSLDEGGKFLYLQSVLASGDPRAPLPYPGRGLDPGLEAVPLFYWIKAGAEIYPWWPVGFPLLSLPFYQVFGWLGLYIVPAAAGALCAGWAGWLTRRSAPDAPAWLAAAAAVVTGLATPVFIYSTLFWEHTLCVAAYLGLLAAVQQAWSTGRARWLVAAGALAAGAVFLRSDMALYLAGVLLTLLVWRWRWAVILGVVFGVSCLPWLALNWYWMGDFISRQAPAVAGNPLFGGFREAGWWFIPYALLNAPRVLALALGPLTLTGGLILIGLALSAPLVPRLRWLMAGAAAGLAGLGALVLFDASGYRSVHGLVLIAPQIVFAAWSYTPQRPRSAALLATMAAAGAGIYWAGYLARGWVAAGGLQWGPRYMLVLYPLGVALGLVGLWSAWPSLGRRLRWALIAAYLACAGVGLGFEARGAAAVGWTVNAYARAGQAIRALPVDVIVTPCTWLTMVIPDLYWEGRVFAPGDQERWAAQARAAGADSLARVEMNACQNVPLDEVARLDLQWPSGIAVTLLPPPPAP